ncbi:MAG TPA: glycine zipper 2TM domain-containing protein [Gammaproteobacteria bacterium]|nr:glycine zipper 2TM domain-containing protein [Gammaproteobacteria bacterium]
MANQFESYAPRNTPAKRLHLPVIALAAAITLALGGCQTTDPYTGEQKTSNTTKGAGIGAVGGAIAGAIFGGSRKSVLLGAGIGALAGGLAGNYMDRQETELRTRLQNTGVSVTRVGDSIILNMPGNVTFATDSSNISADFYQVLDSVALVINKFEKTYVDVVGHTDSTGSRDYNQRLSVARATSVARYLESQKVLPQRILTSGMGQDAPIASNETPEGRALNRRVEIKLTPIT